jgi:hypothetical protein
MIKQMEWVRDFQGQIVSNVERPPTGPAVREYQGSAEPIEYKRGQTIDVEVMGDGHFRDIKSNHMFFVEDENAYRLF